MRAIDVIKERMVNAGYMIVAEGKDGFSAAMIDEDKPKTMVICSWGKQWDHVSISHLDCTPSWETMCEIKDLVWHDSECCVQYHPAKKDYVNQHECCLHIWKPNGRIVLPTPPTWMIGYKDDGTPKVKK